MNSRIDQLVRTLLQKDNLEQCSIGELREFADRNPYFGAAQLLLTKKMQVENREDFTEQLQKTLLFFHNPVWVDHLLNETGGVQVRKKVEEEVKEVNAIVVEGKVDHKEEKGADVPGNGIRIDQQEHSAELLFEPYYAVDYFASQGIKLKEEEKGTDKFSKQLMSFTEWLKTMKRLPVSEIAAHVPAVAENKVVEMAEISLKEREVVTEAMAEVWEKQGNHNKAIAIYQKLSLLEPSKNAYFAAKIEDLKK
jgi:hypothetical protein